MMLLDGSGGGGADQGGFQPYEPFGADAEPMAFSPASYGGGGGGGGGYGAGDPYAAAQQQQQLPPAQPPQHHQQQAAAAPRAPPATQRGQAAPPVVGVAASAPPIGMYPLSQQQQQQLAASLSTWQAQQAALAAQMQEPGYLDSLWSRKRDLFKLCVLALVILLAISAHTAVWHYLEDFVDASDLTPGRELALRLAYPGAVLVVLWHFKAFLLGGGGGKAR